MLHYYSDDNAVEKEEEGKNQCLLSKVDCDEEKQLKVVLQLLYLQVEKIYVYPRGKKKKNKEEEEEGLFVPKFFDQAKEEEEIKVVVVMDVIDEFFHVGDYIDFVVDVDEDDVVDDDKAVKLVVADNEKNMGQASSLNYYMAMVQEVDALFFPACLSRLLVLKNISSASYFIVLTILLRFMSV